MADAYSHEITVYQWTAVLNDNENPSHPVPTCGNKYYYTKEHASSAATRALSTYVGPLQEIKYSQKTLNVPENFELQIFTYENLIRTIMQMTWYKIVKYIVKEQCPGCKSDHPKQNKLHEQPDKGCIYLYRNNLAERKYWDLARTMGDQVTLQHMVRQCLDILNLRMQRFHDLLHKTYNNLPPNNVLRHCTMRVKDMEESPEYYLVSQAADKFDLLHHVQSFYCDDYAEQLYEPSQDDEWWYS